MTIRRVLSVALLSAASSSILLAQRPTVRDSVRAARDSAARAHPLDAMTVTATRTPTDLFDTASPVSVIDSTAMREHLADSPIDLFRQLPGLDVTGVGTNQARPSIRGLRGQRILLMEDGIRLNNSRRQQDFGELPATAGITGIDRVEVVRGPASVLYGTDAIGGVVNLISAPLPGADADGEVHGAASYLYRSEGGQSLPSATVQGRAGRVSFRANGAYRDTEAYDAPSGTFGGITLANDARVNDTGVRDRSVDVALGFDLAPGQRMTAKAQGYRADHAGFGYVTPQLLGGDQLIQIRYPDQRVARYSLGYSAARIATPIANRIDITAYTQANTRDLAQNILIPIHDPRLPPGTAVRYQSTNFTDLATIGLRAEVTKLLGRHALTYGVDAFRDRSTNRDSSLSAFEMPGVPTQPDVSNTPQVPNASFSSMGAFAQASLNPAERLQLIIGGRLQNVRAETRETPGITRPSLESRNTTAVGAANVLVRALPSLNLVASVGRGFRAPNLVERFFEGPTPEGSGYQKANTDLAPETSVNVDVGARWRLGGLFADAFVFRNQIRDGISIASTGDTVSGLPAFRNVNVDRVRYQGLELLAGTRLLDLFTVSASFTRQSSKNLSSPEIPIGDTYASKLALDVAYRSAGGRLWAGYAVRHNGKQKDVVLGDDNPLGAVLPAFTVQQARAGIVLLDRGPIRNSLALVVDNLTNQLYAEFSNASFFRPEPRRSVGLSFITEF